METAKHTLALIGFEEIECTLDECMKVHLNERACACAQCICKHMYGYVHRPMRKLVSNVWNWIWNTINSQRNWNYGLPFFLFIYFFLCFRAFAEMFVAIAREQHDSMQCNGHFLIFFLVFHCSPSITLSHRGISISLR